jgi:L-threonylcarbamoyladenylate synthase
MMHRLAVDLHCPDAATVRTAVTVLRRGGVLAYPTDTVYGLAVDAMNPAAIARLYEVKQRPAAKALPVIIGALEQLSQLVVTPSETAQQLIAAFWPGPLTLLMRPQVHVLSILRGGSERLGVRWPQAELCQQLALGLGGAITATSANLSGRPAALTACDVEEQFAGTIDLILDGGTMPSPEVSTVLDVAVEPARLQRAGKITAATLATVLGYPLAEPTDKPR